MANLVFDLQAFEAAGGTQADLDALMGRIVARTLFDLATPDPEFPGFTDEDDDQLPGRPLVGKLEIGTIFDCLLLLVTNEQQEGSVNGELIFGHLKGTEALVLGPNIGQFLYENQHLIPFELQGKVVLVFWGKIYRDSARRRYVRCLCWSSERLVWGYCWVDYGYWNAKDCAVVLAKKS
jgi:hypothetical protein